jgi:hypothetical protein
MAQNCPNREATASVGRGTRLRFHDGRFDPRLHWVYRYFVTENTVKRSPRVVNENRSRHTRSG